MNGLCAFSFLWMKKMVEGDENLSIAAGIVTKRIKLLKIKEMVLSSHFILPDSDLRTQTVTQEAHPQSSSSVFFWCGKLRVNTCRGFKCWPSEVTCVWWGVFFYFKDLFVFLFMYTRLFLYMGMWTWLQCPQRPEGGVRHPRAGVHRGCETPTLWVWWTQTLWMCNTLVLTLNHFSGSCQNLDT